jgi:diguanylate cyclase (GGDEF)-like protein
MGGHLQLRGDANASVLVVDDEASIGNSLHEQLARAGYRTAVATSAEAAEVLLARSHFDVLLCDVRMPGRSGLGLVGQVLRAHSSMAAIMMSGLDAPDVADAALALGAYGYLVKPFTPNELLIQVRNALARLELERDEAARRRCLEERKALLERLLDIQRSISYAANLESVLDAIAGGAQQLLGDEVVALALASNTGHQSIVSGRGLPPAHLPVPVPQHDALSRAARNQFVSVLRPRGDEILSASLGIRTRGAVVAPVWDSDVLAGALAVGTAVAEREFSDAEQDAVAILAEHAGIAIREMRSRSMFHDALTNLPSRASFLESLERMGGQPAGLILIDLDGFRAATENMTRPAADELLLAAAQRVIASAPPEGVVARLGPDEFGVLLPATSTSDLEAVAARAIASFEAPFHAYDHPVELSASAGVAWSEAISADLLRDASVALCRAKRRGKRRWETFGAAIQRALVAQFDLESDLEGAVERGEIRVVYQPIVELSSGRVAGFEALARWEHPTRGVIPPLEFIPLAEGLGLVGEIGRHVLDVAVRRAANWHAQQTVRWAPWVSVNFSAHELERPDFVAAIATTLARRQLPPQALVVEITEGVLIGDTEVARQRLEGVRALGTRIAIDDFGTGHASLEYVRRLPFDILKIAREFCDGADGSPEEADLVRTLVNLARSFGLQVIAEGIERVEQADALIEMGAPLGQGYYLGRPLEPEAVDSFMEHRRPRRIGAVSTEAA